MDPVAAHDAVDSAAVLELQHLAFALDIGTIERFGNDAIAACRFELVEPTLCNVDVRRRGCEPPVTVNLMHYRLEALATFREGGISQVSSVVRKQVESNERRRRFLREFRNSALGGMDPLLEHVERKSILIDHDDLTVDHRPVRHRGNDLHKLGEVTQQRPLLARVKSWLPFARSNRAKAVPLRLERPTFGRPPGRHLRLHRNDGEFERDVCAHESTIEDAAALGSGSLIPPRTDGAVTVARAVGARNYDAAVLIRTPFGEMYEIGVSGSLFVEPGDSTTDLPDTSDLWALPGLADCHSHVSMESIDNVAAITDATMRESIPKNSWAHVEHGVLLLIDKGGKSDVSVSVLDHDADLRPDVEAAGAMIAPGGGYYSGFGAEVEPDDLVQHIASSAATSGGWVKLVGDWPRKGQGPVNNWSYDVLIEAVTTAHLAGARVAIHSMAHSASEAVAAGVDSIEHGPYLTEEDLTILAQRGGAWVPTIVNMYKLVEMLGADSSGGRMFKGGIEKMRDNLPLAEALGVTVLAGTDMAVSPGKVAVEAMMLHEHGLSDAAALRSVSTDAYAYANRPESPSVGAEADVVFFERSPLEDLSVLSHPALIMRRGRVVGGSLA